MLHSRVINVKEVGGSSPFQGDDLSLLLPKQELRVPSAKALVSLVPSFFQFVSMCHLLPSCPQHNILPVSSWEAETENKKQKQSNKCLKPVGF